MTDIKIKFEAQSFSKRFISMLKVDFRRMFTMPLLYIMVGIAAVIPILVLVMTTSMSGAETATEPAMEAFTNTWQIIASVSGEASAGMSLTSMCNIDMLYFLTAVLVCIFVADDFRSGYAKNLFTVRSKKSDYVISKTIIGFVGGACMIVAFLLGTIAGGAISGLSFEVGAAGVSGIVMCILSKIFLMGIFVSVFLITAVIAKQRLWLSILLSLGIGMLFFNVASMVSPLNSTILNVILSLVGGSIFSICLGMVSNLILTKTNIV